MLLSVQPFQHNFNSIFLGIKIRYSSLQFHEQHSTGDVHFRPINVTISIEKIFLATIERTSGDRFQSVMSPTYEHCQLLSGRMTMIRTE